MASNPPGQCCTIGVRHTGTPQGKMETINNNEVYVSRPSSSSKPHSGVGIIFITDVMGHHVTNPQLIADQLASNGYLTAIPNLFGSDPFDPSKMSLDDWRARHTVEKVEPFVKQGIEYLRSQGCSRIGAVGYCFGVKYVVRGLADGTIDVGYGAHPSFVTEEELAGIKGPLSISAAEVDQIFTTDLRHKSEEILIRTKMPWQINLFSGVSHGFAVRGDPNVPMQKFAKEQAFYQAVQWFDERLLTSKDGSAKI